MHKESERIKIWRDKKRKPCPDCGNLMNYLSEKCKNCYKSKSKEQLIIMEMTIGEYRKKQSGKHGSWANAEIRQFARTWNKELRKKPCQNCGYNKHIELCHIKAVSSFSDTAKLKDVNSKDNLYVLCPNCHWEFDSGLLEINNASIIA